MSGNLPREPRTLDLLLIAALTACAFAPRDARAATQTVTISATADDAVEQGNNVRGIALASMRVWVWQTSPATVANYRAGGLRFPGVAVPSGATVNSATLRVTVPNTSTGDDISATIWGHATDNAADFSANPFILSEAAEPNGRPRTAASVTYTLPNIGTGVKDFDVTTVVREIVGRAGWQPGNALALLLVPGVGAVQQIDFCDISSSAPCAAATTSAQLLLDYTPPSITLAEHGSGQIGDQFTAAPTVNDAPLFRFRLTNTTGAPVTVDSILFRLGRVWRVYRDDVTDLRINDGTVDVATGGAVAIGGRAGTFYFGGDFSVPASATVDYTVTGDVAAIEGWDTITVSLQVGDITLAAGTKGGAVASKAWHLGDSPLGRMNVIHSNKVALGAPNNLEYSLFSTTWAPTPGAVGVNDVPDSLWWKTLITKPDYSRQAAVAMTDGGGGRPRLHASFWDGTSWNYGTTTPLQDSYDVAAPMAGMEGGFNRTFGAAFEAVSGRLVIASGINTAGTIRYSVYDGASWVRNFVSESSMGVNGWYQWTSLVSIPGTNKVAFIGTCSAPSSGDGSVAIWDGDTNTWTSKSGIGLTVNNILGRAFDMTTVRGGVNAREVVAAYAQSNVIRYATYRVNNPAPAWNVGSIAVTLGAGNNPQWLRLAADPTDGDMVLAFETATNEIRTITYNASTRTWGTVSLPLTSAAYGNVDYNRPFDVVWDAWGGTNRVLLVYSDGTALRYQLSTDGGASWGGEQTLDATRQAYWVQLATEPNGYVHLAVNDQNDDLNAWTWDGAAWTFRTPTAIASDLGWANNSGHDHAIEPFALADFPADATTRTRYRSIGTAPDYTTGTVTVASGSTSVTGTGTAWKTSNRGRGDRLTIGTNHYVVLSVASDTQLSLASPAAAAATNSAYTLARQFTTLGDWADCVRFAVPCVFFPVASASLVADDRREVGIAYDDATPAFTSGVAILGATTDADHNITLTADGPNRHTGVAGTGVVVSGGGSSTAIEIYAHHTVVQWLDVTGFSGPGYQVFGARDVLLENVISRQNEYGVGFGGGTPGSLTLRNSLLHSNSSDGIGNGSGGASPDTVTVQSTTIYGNGDMGVDDDSGRVSGTIVDTISMSNGCATVCGSRPDIDSSITCSGGTVACYTQAWNVTSDATAAGSGSKPNLGATDNASTCSDPEGCVAFQSLVPGSENLHLRSASYANQAMDAGTSLFPAFALDVDSQTRAGAWDVGADEFGATTAVTLLSFEAAPSDGAVDLAWRTGAEVDNLGFHVYRGLSPDGPWTRLTSSLVPGQGFSATGAAYAWHDRGLANGTRYFYRLEDVDSKSVATVHGPVSAVPGSAPAPPPGGGSGGEGGGGGSEGGSGHADSSCPSWALAQIGASASSYTCEAHGDPFASSFRILSRSARSTTVELQTSGFLTARDASGRVRALVPGFDSLADPLGPALPLKRASIDGLVGRKARIGAVQARDVRSFPGLLPAAVGYPQVTVGADGTVRPGRREAEPPAASRGVLPRDLARLAGEGFLGEEKTLSLEMTPLRFDAARGSLVLARRLTVRIDFASRQARETGSGRLGRRIPRTRPDSNAHAFLGTTRTGLHAVPFEALFPGRTRPIDLASLRLTKDQGRTLVPFHVLPEAPSFGPGGRLFFHVDATALSTAFSAELVFALERGTGGAQMPRGDAAPDGPAGVSSRGTASFETNRVFAPDLLDAADLWLWESMNGGVSKTKTFALDGLDTASSEAARLAVFLQGGSDAVSVVDHHVQVLLNGSPVAETTFDGMVPHRLDVDLPVSLLRTDRPNDLTVANVGDTGVSSRVFLDRFEMLYPQTAAARSGVFEGFFSTAGTAEVSGLAAPLALVDVTSSAWLTGYEVGTSLRFRPVPGHRTLAVSQEGVLLPRVFFPVPSARLRNPANQADYVLVAPQAFMTAAQPLLDRRQAQGLNAFAASLEEIASSFGSGEPSAQALRDFLSFAYHHWTRPSPRYVLLLGDSNHDPRRFNPASQPSPLPFLLQRTSYIWTASDPALASLNGDDPLPDLAIGRLPATTLDQAHTLVAKVLDWEDQGHSLDGPAALVADNPDLAGDFEADLRDIEASFLQGRQTTQVFLGQIGSRDEARSRILDALNGGLSLISYAGHGGGAVWAGENILNSQDASSLLAQPRQPFMLTMNCLNGYFIAPFYESLAEGFLKAPDRGTVASFSPSGLSLDGPAHLYHRALMAEITGGQHQRLGDAVTAAQKAYAQTGAMPELLALYHLFGDPAMRIR